MLEGIDDVAWASYHHAFGPAIDVPNDVRGLLSDDANVRETAIRRLYATVFHQGTRYRASRHVVPFLVELAISPDVANRADIISLIGHLAVGYPDAWMVRGVDPSDLFPGHQEWAAGRNKYQVDELDVYQAVCAEGDRLLALCSDDDPDVRRAAVFVIAFLPCLGHVALEALVAATARETDPQLRANSVIAASVLAQSIDACPDLGLDELAGSADSIVRYAAAIASMRLDANASTGTVACLVDAIAEPPDSALEWYEGDLSGLAALTLSASAGGLPRVAIDAMCDQLQEAYGPAAERLIGPLLMATFPRGWTSESRSSADLDDNQRIVLQALADSSSAWTWAGMTYVNVAQLLRRFGLPSEQAEMRAYLADHTEWPPPAQG